MGESIVLADMFMVVVFLMMFYNVRNRRRTAVDFDFFNMVGTTEFGSSSITIEQF